MAVTGGLPWLSHPSIGGARPNASVRRVAANYHGIRLAVGAPYGVRSAVTSRACLIMVLLPATRRQEASKFGQAFCEQLGHGIDVQPVGLGEGLRNAGFNLRGKSGKNGECGGNTSCDGNC